MSSGTRSKILVFVIAVLLIANIAILIFFKGPANGANRVPTPGDKPRFGLSVLLKDQIGFSAEQLVTFEQYKAKHKENVKPFFDSLKNAKTNFYAMLNDKSVSDSIMITNSAVNIGKWQSQIDLAFFAYFQKVRNLCTAEQRIKYDSLLPGFLEKMITPPYIRNNRSPNPNEPAKKN